MPWWCDFYGGFLFSLGVVLLIVASLAAAFEACVVLWARIEALKQARSETERPITQAIEAADPVAFLEALKGFLQALKDLPTWLALFGAGLVLAFLAGQEIPACADQAGDSAGACTGGGNSSGNGMINSVTTTTTTRTTTTKG